MEILESMIKDQIMLRGRITKIITILKVILEI